MLSILYNGDSRYYIGYPDVKSSWRNYPDVYGITIDIKKAKKLKLSDFTKIDINLIKKIKKSEYATNASVEKYLLDKEKSDDIVQYRKDWIFEIQEIKDEYIVDELKSDDYKTNFV